jgi:hypothetical protein
MVTEMWRVLSLADSSSRASLNIGRNRGWIGGQACASDGTDRFVARPAAD